MDYRTELEKTVQDMRRLRAADTLALRSLPDGNITVYHDGPRIRYIHEWMERGVRKHKDITRNGKLVAKLLRKRYLKAEAALIDADLKTMTSALIHISGNLTEKVISTLSPPFHEFPRDSFIKPPAFLPHPSSDPGCIIRNLGETRCLSDYGVGISPEDWAEMPYRENTAFLGNKTVTAENGLLTRSKSEADFTRFYDTRGILYHYDEIFLYLDRTEYDPNGTIRYISPDFVLLRPDGSFLFHEHFGRTDDKEYMMRSIEKLYTYIRLGIMPGIDLMITFELPGGGIDLRLAEAQLDSMLYR